MTVESKKMLSMVAAIGNGIKKKNSHLVSDAEESKLWDRLEIDIAETKKRHPGAVIDVPSDD